MSQKLFLNNIWRQVAWWRGSWEEGSILVWEDLVEGLWIMIIVFIDKGLKVSYFDLFSAAFTFHEWIKLNHWMCQVTRDMIFKKSLYNFVVFEFSRCDPKYLICLLFGNKSALNSKSFFSNLLSTFVAKLLHLTL